MQWAHRLICFDKLKQMLTKYRQEKGNDHESWEDFLNFIPSFALMRSEKPMLYWSRQDDI